MIGLVGYNLISKGSLMNILVVGSGAREYAILRALSGKNHTLFCATGNAKTSDFATNVDITDLVALSEFALKEKIDLTIVGPEDPLTKGIVDIFEQKNLVIFGPSKEAARLEGSKVFMKDFLHKYNIPTAKYIKTSVLQTAKDFIAQMTPPIVVKADGLCAGKGVIIAKNAHEAIKASEDMLSGKSFGEAGKQIVIEQFLDGFELSVFALCDGNDFALLPICADHKRLLDNDEGPNTGGMGAFCPVPNLDDQLLEKINTKIITPTLDGMKKEGTPFVGVLFCGIMVVDNEPFTLEFNVRFGDPECEVLMPMLDCDLADLLFKASTKNIKNASFKIKNGFSVCVVAASEGYPTSHPKDSVITYPPNEDDAHLCFAGVSEDDNGLIASGGRVLLSVGSSTDLAVAQKRAYELLSKVHFDGMHFRKDIAKRFL